MGNVNNRPFPRCPLPLFHGRSLKIARGLDLKGQAQVFQRLDNTIHWINRYPGESVVCFVNVYPLDSDLLGGCYPAFEQPGPEG